GPFLSTTRTHLQRELGDNSVLTVKFAEEATGCPNKVTCSSNYAAVFNKIADEGILVGLRRYRFFGDDENGYVVCDEEGEPLIHTDGTGYISEDLALKMPKDFSKAKYINEENFEVNDLTLPEYIVFLLPESVSMPADKVNHVYISSSFSCPEPSMLEAWDVDLGSSTSVLQGLGAC
ncbi:RNA-directed RNA polymerase, partial [Sarracenia purpurea var. burkii]